MQASNELIDAIRSYWSIRLLQGDRQGANGDKDSGERRSVTGGQHMDAIVDLICQRLRDEGVPDACIYRSSAMELPGYYRPEKKWDLLVVRNSALACAVELKSQAGPSFGNNFNNRVEEAIGNAQDLWTAFREGRFGLARAPWLGYLFLLEDCDQSSSPVKVSEPHFAVDPVFVDASYKQRYELLCKRLVLERLYNGACFITSTRDPENPTVTQPNPDLSFQRFVDHLIGHVKCFMA
ncbi:MAG: PaeR7I family type II restriction endonuclease [Clostridia bacterium]|nr:PaeR7I family type II restriction endonuclease [Clostridia bacterium]